MHVIFMGFLQNRFVTANYELFLPVLCSELKISEGLSFFEAIRDLVFTEFLLSEHKRVLLWRKLAFYLLRVSKKSNIYIYLFVKYKSVLADAQSFTWIVYISSSWVERKYIKLFARETVRIDHRYM